MVYNSELHCINCWWTTREGGTANCRRCGAPLYLPDGRSVTDIITRAGWQAAQYQEAGHNPALAPAVVQAQAIMAGTAVTRDWLFWVRLFTFISWAAVMFSLLLAPATVAVLVTNPQTQQSVSQSVDVRGPIVMVALISTIWTAVCLWLLRSRAFRVLMLVLAVLQVAGIVLAVAMPTLVPQYSSQPWLLAIALVTGVVWAALLVLSLLYDRSR